MEFGVTKVAKRATSKAKRKPAVFGVAKAIKKAPAKRAPKDTRESLIAQMGKLFDAVDQLLPTLKDFSWHWPQQPKLRQARMDCDALVVRMHKLLDPNSDESPQEVFAVALGVVGSVPSVARPGNFVEWVGPIPVLCAWGGFMERSADLRMIDPAEQWISETGYLSMHPDPRPGCLEVRTSFREWLEQFVGAPKFKLHDVSDYGREQAVERLAESEWLRDVLEKGPVDPIPLPNHLLAIPQSFL